MAVAITNVDWSEYHKAHKEDIFALGIIAMTYGELENVFRKLFSAITGLNEFQTAALFERLPNNHRLAILGQLLAQTALSREIKDDVDYFMDGFETCADNRHAVLHAHLGGTFFGSPGQGVVLHKFTKAGKKQTCFAPTKKLHEIADSMREYAAFGFSLIARITPVTGAKIPNDNSSVLFSPFRGKPSPPPKLDWRDL
jgi:hypothetical protein